MSKKVAYEDLTRILASEHSEIHDCFEAELDDVENEIEQMVAMKLSALKTSVKQLIKNESDRLTEALSNILSEHDVQLADLRDAVGVKYEFTEPKPAEYKLVKQAKAEQPNTATLVSTSTEAKRKPGRPKKVA